MKVVSNESDAEYVTVRLRDSLATNAQHRLLDMPIDEQFAYGVRFARDREKPRFESATQLRSLVHDGQPGHTTERSYSRCRSRSSLSLVRRLQSRTELDQHHTIPGERD